MAAVRRLEWDEVFGGLDARTLDHDQRLEFINGKIETALAGKTWTALSGGEEGQLVWDAAVRAFLEGNWLASLLCCHAVCERELAGILTLYPDDQVPEGWERFGMGRLLVELKRLRRLPPDLIEDLFALSKSRKPYGHWRSSLADDAMMARVIRESEATGSVDRNELVQRLLVRDATNAMTTSVALYFGSYGLGGP